MCSHENSRVLVLEEEVNSLSEELMQCQADKEFVWSLWKRLQVANPDLTQAVSLVVEREKHKTELKDRKVLEILQSKDHKIQELEQKVTNQQQEINRLLQKKTTVEEDSALMKELTTLREQLENKNQQLEEMKTKHRKKEEEQQQVVHALEEEKEGLTSRCAALSADLQEKQRQADSQRGEWDAAQARLKDLEKDLQNACQELSKLQAHRAGLAAQLSSKERELAANREQLDQIRRDFAEVQTQYRQNTEHAAEQSHLIRQLEGLNLDTQRVLRNQEEAHTADTTSYQRLYKELSQCYQALVSSESKLRQSHQQLSAKMVQKDEQISELQAQLQKQQEQIHLLQHHAQLAPPSPNRQTNFKAGALQQNTAAQFGWASTQGSNPRPEDRNFHQRSTSSVRRLQGTPVQRSRSLSPASSVGLSSGRRIEAEQRIQDLEELLQLKTEENEELRKAHDKRRERLCLIQTNFKTIRDQMKEMEKSHGLSGGRRQRPEPWQLRQENSDAVWNELAYLKNLNRKLITENCGLVPDVSACKPEPETPDWRMTLRTIRNGIHRIDTYLNVALDLFGGDDGLCRYRCSDGYKPMPRPGYRHPPPNGCGSPLFGFQFDLGIPSMTKCCNQHDRCYDTCGREKHDCDEQFQDCLETICRNVQRTLGLAQRVKACESAVTLLFDAVMHLGCKPYLDSQREACVCQYEVKKEL